MIDPIGNSTNATATQRAQSTAQANSVRSAAVITAVQQSAQKSSNAVAPVKIFAAPQPTKSGTTSGTKVPRGSLVDVLA